ncbi:MAG: hypothetical protein GEU74_11405 [Nitriliruptorales bacterium]|nr:hypothetical protein [Nitriliruptorales bacterium]
MPETFAFAFDRVYQPLLALAGIFPGRADVMVDDDELRVRFGMLTLTTPRSNIASAQVTGPHNPLKAIGVRTSFTDRGLTFGSSAGRTTCILFQQPVRTRPFDVARHPGLTVSVERPDDLAALLNP